MKVSHIIRAFHRLSPSSLSSCNKSAHFLVLCIVKVKKLLKSKISGKLLKFSLAFWHCHSALDFKLHFSVTFFFLQNKCICINCYRILHGHIRTSGGIHSKFWTSSKLFAKYNRPPPPLTTTKKEKKEMCSWSIKVYNELCLYWCGWVLAWVYTSSSLL